MQPPPDNIIPIADRIKHLKKHLVKINSTMYPDEYDESKALVVTAIHDRISSLKEEHREQKLVLVKRDV